MTQIEMILIANASWKEILHCDIANIFANNLRQYTLALRLSQEGLLGGIPDLRLS
jgi:hypothetical protein